MRFVLDVCSTVFVVENFEKVSPTTHPKLFERICFPEHQMSDEMNKIIGYQTRTDVADVLTEDSQSEVHKDQTDWDNINVAKIVEEASGMVEMKRKEYEI